MPNLLRFYIRKRKSIQLSRLHALLRIRTDYLHEVQNRLDAEKKDLLDIIEGDYTTREINAAKRQLTVLDRKIEELKAYDEVLHHMADMQIEIDLDDGVKVNDGMFKG